MRNFFRRFIPLAAVLLASCLAYGQGTATTVMGNDLGGFIPQAESLNLPGTIAAGVAIDSNGSISASGNIEGATFIGDAAQLGTASFSGEITANSAAISVNEITANDGTIDLTGGVAATGAISTETTVSAQGAVTGKVSLPGGATGYGECIVIGAETLTLPEASAGLHVYIVADNASSVIAPASGDTISISGATGVAPGTTGIEANPSEVPAGIELIAIDSTRWIAIGDYPTWNLEPE